MVDGYAKVGILDFWNSVVGYICRANEIELVEAYSTASGDYHATLPVERNTAYYWMTVAGCHRSYGSMQPYYPLVVGDTHWRFKRVGDDCCPSLIYFSIEAMSTRDLIKTVDSEGATS
ncbi:hypothetical protein PIB30_039284 [Stylosanthes scabra]|uniref:Uncharacterized protein n=1 Tax=Stylosanthes scabra TaxID=79078 RepID=A0ABU6XBY6_9FABA|nr:hypothetical protein [Stylosanthes scabra]